MTHVEMKRDCLTNKLFEKNYPKEKKNTKYSPIITKNQKSILCIISRTRYAITMCKNVRAICRILSEEKRTGQISLYIDTDRYVHMQTHAHTHDVGVWVYICIHVRL